MDVLGIFTHLQGENGGWSRWEMNELSRLKAASSAFLENQIWEGGVTDSGDPWIVAVDESNLDLSLHIARLDGGYIAVSGDLAPVSSSANLKTIVSDCLAHMRLNRQEAIVADGATIRMPIGVSVAAFGILITERMNSLDTKQSSDQSDLQIGHLGSDNIDSFVFLDRNAEDQDLNRFDELVTNLFDEDFTPSMDQPVAGDLEHHGGSHSIAGGPPPVNRPARVEEKVEVASETEVSLKAAEAPEVTAPTVAQAAEAPTSQATTPGQGQSSQTTGGDVIVTAVGGQIVGEEPSDNDEKPDQPEGDGEMKAVSADADVPEGMDPFGSDLLANQGDTLFISAASFDPAPPAAPPISLIADADHLAHHWPSGDSAHDLFQI